MTAIVEGTHRSEFTYDGLSRRVRIVEKENGVVQSDKHYFWIGGSIECERDGLQAGNPITKRYFGQGLVDGGTKLYYTRDQLGSVRQVVDSNVSFP
jgi:YD repeat-containing protein